MPKLTLLKLDDGTVIYVEATDNVDVPFINTEESSKDVERGRDDYGLSEEIQAKAIQSFQAIETTIRAYTTSTLNVFKQVAIANVDIANVDKVTLEFGIKVAAEAGVPYITKGTAESNLKITVEYSLSNSVNSKA